MRGEQSLEQYYAECNSRDEQFRNFHERRKFDHDEFDERGFEQREFERDAREHSNVGGRRGGSFRGSSFDRRARGFYGRMVAAGGAHLHARVLRNHRATTTQYVGAPRFPPSNPASVEILRTEPIRLHVRLGEIVIEASTEPAPPITEVEDKLRAEAAKLGAEAVVVVVDRIQPVGAFVSGPWWGGDVDIIKGRKLIGVAIRYQR
jgi:hypothetical protein